QRQLYAAEVANPARLRADDIEVVLPAWPQETGVQHDDIEGDVAQPSGAAEHRVVVDDLVTPRTGVESAQVMADGGTLKEPAAIKDQDAPCWGGHRPQRKILGRTTQGEMGHRPVAEFAKAFATGRCPILNGDDLSAPGTLASSATSTSTVLQRSSTWP